MPVCGVDASCISSSVSCRSLVTTGHAQAAPDTACYRHKAPWRASSPPWVWQVTGPEAPRWDGASTWNGSCGEAVDRVSPGLFQCISLDHAGLSSSTRQPSLLPARCCDLWLSSSSDSFWEGEPPGAGGEEDAVGQPAFPEPGLACGLLTSVVAAEPSALPSALLSAAASRPPDPSQNILRS